MLRGIAVICTVCGLRKKPHGRSAPPEIHYCNQDCSGYQDEPKPGCLWPGETEADFGYPICDNATEEIPA
jgi:hypothetical protein